MSISQAMLEHDLLPREGRFLGAYLTAKWVPENIADALFLARHLPSKRERTAFASKALRRLEGLDTWRDYGPLHPECPAHLKYKPAPKGAWWAKGGTHGRA